MEIYLKEAANKQSCLRFPSLPDKEITVKGNSKYQKYDLIKKEPLHFRLVRISDHMNGMDTSGEEPEKRCPPYIRSGWIRNLL